MKKSSALFVVMILSFMISVYAGQAFVNYIFEEEYVATAENDKSNDNFNTEDKNLAKGTNDNKDDNL